MVMKYRKGINYNFQKALRGWVPSSKIVLLSFYTRVWNSEKAEYSLTKQIQALTNNKYNNFSGSLHPEIILLGEVF